MNEEKKKLTSVSGRPIAENQNVKTAGKKGPMLLEDFWFLEKLAHFDREVIPERRMHAKGSGAFGTFTVTHDISQYTKAKIFSEIGKKTDLFVRFSTVAGERGAADAERDIRGFAIKFYTEEGNWDMAGNNTPVFFLKDPSVLILLKDLLKKLYIFVFKSLQAVCFQPREVLDFSKLSFFELEAFTSSCTMVSVSSPDAIPVNLIDIL